MIVIKKNKLINLVIIIFTLIAVFFGTVIYFKLNKIKIDKPIPVINEAEKTTLISKVSRLYLFPEGEVPTIAIVSDPKLLGDQAFFTESKKGDNVLIFLKSGKAVLYRPSIDKIIEISPIKNNREIE